MVCFIVAALFFFTYASSETWCWFSVKLLILRNRSNFADDKYLQIWYQKALFKFTWEQNYLLNMIS